MAYIYLDKLFHELRGGTAVGDAYGGGARGANGQLDANRLLRTFTRAAAGKVAIR